MNMMKIAKYPVPFVLKNAEMEEIVTGYQKKRESIIINLTPHDVKLLCDGKEHVFLKSGTIARVSSKSEFSHSVNGLPVHKTIYGEVENLPEPQEGVIYIVALLVAQVLAGTRTDIICPDTGPDSAVRDDKGLIAGVKRFMIP